MFTKKGSVIRRELERFIVDEEIKRGYDHVHTPDIANVELYEKSGHYPYYKDSMYPVMQVGDERLILRPMTCPHHFQLYASRPRSYKELPMRIAELASQYRYEKSGELTGLIRVRLFCLADAHIICQKDKAEEEIDGVLDLIDYVAKVLGLKKGKDYRYRLSMGDRKDDKKYYKDDKAWDFAEEVLRKALKKRKAPFYEEEGEAAFYGPKIDVQMKNVLEKEETAFTVQYDFVMPKRFNLKYIDKDGKDKEPVIIHRSSIGALERVLALLIEHHAGNFPVWLSPVQVKVLPITERNIKYAKSIGEKIKAENIRVEIDERNETLPAKIRNAQLEKVPYMLIVGDKEEKNKKVSLRLRTEKDLGETSLKIFIEKVKKNITEKSLKL
jgi:threonyl-tRNA synthetase